MKIDSHQHFWKFDPLRDSWITEEMGVIRRDFLPNDLKNILTENKIEGCVAVQADQSELQNDFLLELANENDFIKGIVGWVDLRAKNVEERLAYYQTKKKIKGFRHVLQGESDRAFMLQTEFLNGISALSKFGFTYDILIFPDQLKFIPEFVNKFPKQRFVIDHIAKPNIKNSEIKQWEQDIRKVAQSENVSCKVSGMVTEADWNHWKTSDFTPYLDVVFNAFGIHRLMYGSDWPVCVVAGGYNKAKQILEAYTATLSESEYSLFWGRNAVEFYNL